MSYSRQTLSALVLLCGAWFGVNQADEPQLLPQAGVLVLRTGTVLRGEIVRVGDRYLVTLSGNDEVGVPVAHVQMHCASLDEAYERKRALLPVPAGASDHLQLADWCLRYELLASAAEQLMAAQSLAPDDPAPALFEKRLRLAAQRPPQHPRGGEVTELPTPPAARDQTARPLAPGTVEQFTSTIQPLLINRCGAGACHGSPANASFSLIFPQGSRVLPRRFTQRNLQTALELLDHETPERSPLLQMATTAHGGAASAALSPQDVTPLRHLVRWVHHSAGHTWSETSRPQATAAGPGPPQAVAAPRLAPSAPEGAAPLDDDWAPPATTDQLVQPVQHTETVPAQFPQGRDPFDPEVFNRRYLPSGG
jgi:hypothetical protein